MIPGLGRSEVVIIYPDGFMFETTSVNPSVYSNLIGIMISKTIGFRGLAYFQTHPVDQDTKLWYPLNQDP